MLHKKRQQINPHNAYSSKLVCPADCKLLKEEDQNCPKLSCINIAWNILIAAKPKMW